MKNLTQTRIRFMVSMLSVILFTHVSGCSKGPVPATFIEHDSFTNSDWYLVHYELKTEQWNDPEVLSTPRVQFVWSAPGTAPEDKAVWSMRTDGSDLRQVISAELFDTPLPGGTNSGVQFQRSPNNRYLAIAVLTKGQGFQRRIIDLETKEVTVIPDYGYGDPHFEWLNDHILLFSSKSPLMQFDILTKELIDLKDAFVGVNIRYYHSYDSGKKVILADVNNHGYMFDFDSKKMIADLGEIGFKLTKDEKYWLGWAWKRNQKEGFGDVRVYAFDDLKNELGAYARDMQSYSESIYGLDEAYGESVYGITSAKMDNPKISIFELPGKRSVGNFSLYNAESVLGSRKNSKDSD